MFILASTGSMSPTRNYSRVLAPGSRGFTLVELLVATSIATVLMAGMLSSYLFLGRNLVRNSNRQQLEAQSRVFLQAFARDVGMADQIAGAYDAIANDITKDPSWQAPLTSNKVAFRMRAGNDGEYYYAVTYTYDTNADTVTRTESKRTKSGTPPLPDNPPLTLLGTPPLPDTPPLTLLTHADRTHASDFSFHYYPDQKQIEVVFTLTKGIAAADTQWKFTGASARLVLRNRHLVN
jgi:prepilin-type N-terminal cleavage/methylation domain-containing protein